MIKQIVVIDGDDMQKNTKTEANHVCMLKC